MVWGTTPLPRLLAALMCEDVALSIGVDDARVSLQRVFFEVSAARFPASFDRLNVVLHWHSVEEGNYRVTVRVIAPDGKEVASGELPLATSAGRQVTAQALYFPLVPLPEAGVYAVGIALDGRDVHALSWYVGEIAQEETDGQG